MGGSGLIWSMVAPERVAHCLSQFSISVAAASSLTNLGSMSCSIALVASQSGCSDCSSSKSRISSLKFSISDSATCLRPEKFPITRKLATKKSATAKIISRRFSLFLRDAIPFFLRVAAVFIAPLEPEGRGSILEPGIDSRPLQPFPLIVPHCRSPH